jgi:hypothetical protein
MTKNEGLHGARYIKDCETTQIVSFHELKNSNMIN